MEQNDASIEQGTMPEVHEEENMADLLEQEGLGIDFPKRGEIRDGIIASVSPGQILVSVGAKSEGVIAGKEFDLIPPEELEALEVGQKVPVYVINPEDQGGNLILSLTRAREAVSWKESEELLKSKEAFHSTIIGYNKGGLIVPMSGLRGFVPASQISLSRRADVTGDTPEQRWAEMVGDEIDVCVIEVDPERRRLILSERAASSETRESLKEKVIAELTEGEIKTGRVTSLADFGAFVNISGADGLVHLSEIAWERIKHPSEILSVGEEVEVKIISIDREKKRIGLSIRQLQKDPMAQRLKDYEVGQLVEATITRLTKFGAFARLEENLEGLIHISEISERRIEHPKEVLHEGETVTLRVIRVEPLNHRIGLSLRRVESMAFAEKDWETLLGDDDDAAEEASEVEEAVVAEETPADEETAVVEEAPEAEEVPVAEKAPAVEEAPAEAETPASEDTPETTEEE
ncbi:MAG: S1 RNA-binding domain-containing protein [Anaerolineaceae bacterium]|jgi:small subunit ribosomal protein S1|nr:S1 RNA-binding domain-containing protein [Anaerolineaceae bacterium]